jgi:hypothetical protein
MILSVHPSNAAVPTEEQTENLRRFVDDWSSTINDITRELEDAGAAEWSWTVWDHTMDPISLLPTPYDAAQPHHLVHAENPAFAAVAKVLSFLAFQVSKIKREVNNPKPAS